VGTKLSPRPTPEDTSKVAFGRDSRIWLMRPDGSNQGPLTDPSHLMGDSDWLPDGSRLVAVEWHVNLWGYWIGNLVLVNPADGSFRALTSGEAGYGAPKWSPNGSLIAFSRSASTGLSSHFDIWTMKTDGSNEREIAGYTGTHFSWSPDGRRLVAECQGGLCAMNPDGSDVQNISDTMNHFSPAWAPGGQRIAAVKSEGSSDTLITMRIDGTDRRVVTTGKGLVSTQIDWSADGRSLVFGGWDPGASQNSYRIWRVGEDGSGLRALTSGNGSRSGDFWPAWWP
jgi:Tol biopolymer transport system component